MDKYKDLLDYLCKMISFKITSRKPIYEKMILDFSLSIDRLIREGIPKELPNSFNRMAGIVENYWYYYSQKEKDSDVCLSYVRIYQTYYLYKVFVSNEILKDRVLKASIKYRRKINLIKAIYESPGVTTNNLCELFKISPTTLFKRIAPLLEEGFVFDTRINDYSFYSLSNSGLDLYKILMENNSSKSD